MRFTCITIGQLRSALSRWPDKKPLILDLQGNSSNVIIEDWANEAPDNLDWPVAINATKGLLEIENMLEAFMSELKSRGVDARPVCTACGQVIKEPKDS